MGTLMDRALAPILLLAICCLPTGAAGAQPQEIPPGMSPRPTAECGGAPMLALWEAERVERLEGIAGEVIGGWIHRLEPRLDGVAQEVERTLKDETRSRYDACLASRAPRSAVCVAAASGRPELCGMVDDPEKRDICRMVVSAIRASETGNLAPCDLLEDPGNRDACVLRATGRPRCTAGGASCLLQSWLTPGSCRSPGALTGSVTALRFLCRWALWIEAARGIGDCARGLGGDWQGGCRAVAARAPEACPPPGRYETGVRLDGPCRDAAVGSVTNPVVRWREGAAVLSVTLFNPFREAARCVLHLEAEAPDGAVRTAVTGVFSLPGNLWSWRGEVVPLDVRVAPASPDWTWTVRPDCTFALHVLEGVGEAGPGAAATFDG